MQIIRKGVVNSTMDECRALFANGVRDMVAVCAEAQTGGRGRVGRAWYSPAGAAVYVSVLLPQPVDVRLVGRYTMLGALAVIDAIAPDVSPSVDVSIKWPNDVMLNGRKAAGVLVESALLGERTEFSVLGVGINVNVDFSQAPEEVRARACSLHEYARETPNRDEILECVVSAIERRAERFLAAPDEVVDDYRARLGTLGREASFVLNGVTRTGRAVRVLEDGALVVVVDGREHVLRFGDLA